MQEDKCTSCLLVPDESEMQCCLINTSPVLPNDRLAAANWKTPSASQALTANRRFKFLFAAIAAIAWRLQNGPAGDRWSLSFTLISIY